MGLSICAILIKTDDMSVAPRLLERLGLWDPTQTAKQESDTFDFDAILETVCGSERSVVGHMNGWVHIFAPPIFEEGLTTVLSEFSQEGDIFMSTEQSTVGGLWFEYHQAGELKRQWGEAEGMIMFNTGEPLLQEPQGLFSDVPSSAAWEELEEAGLIEDCSEWGVIALAESMTGVAWEEMSFTGTIY